MDLRLDDSPAPGVVAVAIGGEVDLLAAGILERFLLGAVAEQRGPKPGLIIDLSEAEFFGCAGLNALLAAQRRLDRAGGWLRLVDVSSAVSRVLDVAGMNTDLRVASSADDHNGLP
ncbi:STAS domain-containing protein [Actinokineospora sp. PR83]|uniref:STAS domain-containing protein n=1 Tax=Actinokineospora sp. PR83 TaxID=2884908 RepID=UPI0027E1F82F|nr:STAS domain-containing protein [Actinokineospora sp. PR83]MCG8920090.1 STAS domain-containing protein [Actinokineospora sp. PR83]